MAFNNLAIVGNALSRDYIWDFGSSAFTLPFTLDISGLDESIEVVTNAGRPNESTITYRPQDTPTTNPNVNASHHFAIRYRPYTGSGIINTKYNFGTPSASLAGPGYGVSYTTPGVVTPTFYLYAEGIATGTIHPGTPWVDKAYEGPKIFTLQIFQQAVSVTKRGSAGGATVVDGATITDMDNTSNKVIIVDKSNNRGVITSTWDIQKQDPNTGVYSAASPGADYNLGVGQSLTSDQIQITWQAIGNFKVYNNCTGQTSGTSGPNVGQSVINFTVGQGVTDTIVLPNVVASITPVIAFNNTVVSLNPLTGINPFRVNVNAIIDTTAASWTQTVGTNAPISLPMSIAAWKTELSSRCIITCQIQQGTNILQSGLGFGPFTFTIPTGVFQVGYTVIPKPGNTVQQALSTYSSF